MKIFEELKEDHQTQRKLSKELMNSTDDADERKEIFKKLKKELKAHAKAEERNFYVPMLEHDQSQKYARHSISEHHEIDEKIEALEKAGLDSADWKKKAKELTDLVHHHLDEEEDEMFKVAGKVFTEEQEQNLGRHYRTMMKEEKE